MSDELARWQEGAESRARRYQALQAEVGKVRATESSGDGKVTVTVDAGGAVTDLRIAGDERTAAEILLAMRRAQSHIPDLIARIMRTDLGEEAADTAVSAYRARFPGLEPVPEGPARAREAKDGKSGQDSDDMGGPIMRPAWS